MPKLQPHELDKGYLVTNYEIDALREIGLEYGVELHPNLKDKGKAADQILEVALTDIKPEKTEKPKKQSKEENVTEEALAQALEPYRAKGLKVSVNDGVFEMKYGRQMDSGNINQPLKNIVACAERIMRFAQRDRIAATEAMKQLEEAQEKVRQLAGNL